MNSNPSLFRGLAFAAALSALLATVNQTGGEPSGPQLCFERREIGNFSGDVKLVGDIDGDGRPDLVLGGLPTDGLSFWRWPDLQRTVIARPDIEFTTDGSLVDLDGDGDIDVVTADGPKGLNLIWFENPGSQVDPSGRVLWKRHSIGAAGDWVKDIKVADFDADGRLDVAARTPRELMVFFRTSVDWTRMLLQGIELGEEGMESGDINGDGRVDLILRGVWASNPGGAIARDPSQWRPFQIGDFNVAFKALVTDLDGDGRPDIVTSSSEHTADVAWYRAGADRSQRWTRSVIQPAAAGVHTLQAADMDNDGDIDVVVGQMHTTRERALTIHYNMDGKGTQWSQQVVDRTGLHNGVVADIDQNGTFDIFGSNWAGNPPLRVWLNGSTTLGHLSGRGCHK
jgi:hypothetical protein